MFIEGSNNNNHKIAKLDIAIDIVPEETEA